MRYYEWDPKKAQANLRKHGVSFEDAIEALEDPNSISWVERFVEDEERWHTIGIVTNLLVVQVSHLVQLDDSQDELVRIISARKATTLERQQYEQNG
jgi:uncharacterized DUF497 family protein